MVVRMGPCVRPGCRCVHGASPWWAWHTAHNCTSIQYLHNYSQRAGARCLNLKNAVTSLKSGCSPILEWHCGDIRLGLADAAILDLYDARARAADADAVGVPRVACDLEAIEIRLVEFDWRREYRRQNGAWILVPVEGFVNTMRIVPGKETPEL